MKLQDLLEELQEKPEYKTFQAQNPDTFFAATFLILNLEQKTEQKCQAQRTNSKEVHIRGTLVPGIIQLDYFLPKENKIAAFEFPFTEPKIHDNIISIEKGQTTKAKPIPMQKQTTEIKIDIDDLATTCNKIIKENDSNLKPTKIIAILKDDIWNLTCMDNALGIIRIKINATTGEQIDFNKGSLMDFMGIKKK